MKIGITFSDVKFELKSSARFRPLYARAMQEERKVLIKAMFVAKGKENEAKVVDRELVSGKNRYTSANIPQEFQES